MLWPRVQLAERLPTYMLNRPDFPEVRVIGIPIRGLVGPLCIVKRGFELGGRDVAEVAVWAAGLCQCTQLGVASSTSSMVLHGSAL